MTDTAKRRCFYVDETMVTPYGYVPVVITEGEPGFSRMIGSDPFQEPWYWGDDLEKAKAIAADANTKLGLSEEDVRQIMFSSIRESIAQDAQREQANERWERIRKGIRVTPRD